MTLRQIAEFWPYTARTQSCPGKAGLTRAALPFAGGAVMPKGKKIRVGIYHPPKSGMLYLVVTVSPNGVIATAVESKDEARVLASKRRTQGVTIDDARVPEGETGSSR
jgi:hypothetical protein